MSTKPPTDAGDDDDLDEATDDDTNNDTNNDTNDHANRGRSEMTTGGVHSDDGFAEVVRP